MFARRWTWALLLLGSNLAASVVGKGNIQYHGSDFQSACLTFDPVQYIPNGTVNAHEFVAAGSTLLFPDNDPSCGRPNQTVSADVCRIALNISTSSRSGVIFEVKYEDINYGTANGFSAVGSNNGHNGTGGSAFFRNDEVIKDYVWRS
jgi:feruloyl esterase